MSTDSHLARRVIGVQKLDSYTAIYEQLDALNKRMDAFQVHQVLNCNFCVGNHPNNKCPLGNQVISTTNADQANYVNNFNQQTIPTIPTATLIILCGVII